MAREHIFVFCYDAAGDKTRRRMSALLEDFGARVQKSVFEVRCSLPRAEKLFAALSAERREGDSVRMYCLTEEARARSRASGGTPIPERQEFWLL